LISKENHQLTNVYALSSYDDETDLILHCVKQVCFVKSVVQYIVMHYSFIWEHTYPCVQLCIFTIPSSPESPETFECRCVCVIIHFSCKHQKWSTAMRTAKPRPHHAEELIHTQKKQNEKLYWKIEVIMSVWTGSTVILFMIRWIKD